MSTRYERMLVKSERIQMRMGSDQAKRPVILRRQKIETPVYEEGRRYTRKQLGYMADEILRARLKEHPNFEYPAILLPEHYKERVKREIYTGVGVPDPSIVAGLYWRTHPRGRTFNTDRRRNREGFYR